MPNISCWETVNFNVTIGFNYTRKEQQESFMELTKQQNFRKYALLSLSLRFCTAGHFSFWLVFLNSFLTFVPFQLYFSNLFCYFYLQQFAQIPRAYYTLFFSAFLTFDVLCKWEDLQVVLPRCMCVSKLSTPFFLKYLFLIKLEKRPMGITQNYSRMSLTKQA